MYFAEVGLSYGLVTKRKTITESLVQHKTQNYADILEVDIQSYKRTKKNKSTVISTNVVPGFRVHRQRLRCICEIHKTNNHH